VGRLALGGRALGRLCATFGVAFGLRLGGRCRLRRDGRGESLNALPDARGGGPAILELPDRLDPGQAAPNREQPLGRPRPGQFGKLLLAAEAVKRVVVVAAASSGVASAVMWLSVSIVKVVIFVVLCSARFAVNTWITPHGWKGKAILNQNDAGERTAIVGRAGIARVALTNGRSSEMYLGSQAK
jgi:hypothetical protein